VYTGSAWVLTYADLATATTDDLTEGSTNLYFSGKTTSDLSEGTNLYYTTARFDTAFSGKTTSDLTEGTNLYYTNARVEAVVDQTYVNNLNVDADTLDGIDSTGFDPAGTAVALAIALG